MSRGNNVQGVFGAISPFWAKWWLGRVPRSPSFFVWKSRWPFGNFATADFHQIRSQNVVRCHVAESWKTLSKIFTLGVICPQNLKSKIGQTGTSLRAGYRMHCREILFTPRCSPRTSEFPRSCQLFSLTYTVAELRGVKFAQFSDFGLFSLHKTPKTYRPVTRLQPRGYIAE